MRLPQLPSKKGRIEIIPMIDAIFFLLVYFIMTSLSLVQMDTHGAQLPRSRSAVARPGGGDRVVIALRRDNAIFIDRGAASELQVRDRVRRRVARNPRVTVLLSADRSADTRRFLRLFDLVKQADAQNVVIATAPDPGATPGRSR